MQKLNLETPELDEIVHRGNAYWRTVLEMNAPELDADAEEPDRLAEPVSFVLPYRESTERYVRHVEQCAVCSQSSLWAVCSEGEELSQQAAEAMSWMEADAEEN